MFLKFTPSTKNFYHGTAQKHFITLISLFFFFFFDRLEATMATPNPKIGDVFLQMVNIFLLFLF